MVRGISFLDKPSFLLPFSFGYQLPIWQVGPLSRSCLALKRLVEIHLREKEQAAEMLKGYVTCITREVRFSHAVLANEITKLFRMYHLFDAQCVSGPGRMTTRSCDILVSYQGTQKREDSRDITEFIFVEIFPLLRALQKSNNMGSTLSYFLQSADTLHSCRLKAKLSLVLLLTNYFR